MINRLLLALILLLAGAALGLSLGLYVGWQVWPVSYHDTTVASLTGDYRDDYVVMVATAYGWDGDLALARERLLALDPADPAAPLAFVEETAARLSQQLNAAADRQADLQRLNRLAVDLRAAGSLPSGSLPSGRAGNAAASPAP